MAMPTSMHIHSSASWSRFEKLIEARTKPDANKAAIDVKIWELFGETWCIMFTDLSGFSRRVEKFGIIHFLQTIHESHRILVPFIDQFNGILLKVEGDSLMVLFKQPSSALEAAMAMQNALFHINKTRLPEEQVLLCIGLGYGEVIKLGDQDVFGAEVNAASKLGEDIAKAQEILATDQFKQHIDNPDIRFQPLDVIPPGAKSAWRIIYPGFTQVSSSV